MSLSLLLRLLLKKYLTDEVVSQDVDQKGLLKILGVPKKILGSETGKNTKKVLREAVKCASGLCEKRAFKIKNDRIRNALNSIIADTALNNGIVRYLIFLILTDLLNQERIDGVF